MKVRIYTCDLVQYKFKGSEILAMLYSLHCCSVPSASLLTQGFWSTLLKIIQNC